MVFEALTDEEYSSLPGDQKMVERLMQVAEYLEAKQLKVISPEEDHLYFPEADTVATEAREERPASGAPAPFKEPRRSRTGARMRKQLREARSDATHADLVRLGTLIRQADLAKTSTSARAMVKAGKVIVNGRAAKSVEATLSIGDEVVVVPTVKARAHKGYYGRFGKAALYYKKRKTAGQIMFVVNADPSKKSGMSLKLKGSEAKAGSRGTKATSAD